MTKYLHLCTVHFAFIHTASNQECLYCLFPAALTPRPHHYHNILVRFVYFGDIWNRDKTLTLLLKRIAIKRCNQRSLRHSSSLPGQSHPPFFFFPTLLLPSLLAVASLFIFWFIFFVLQFYEWVDTCAFSYISISTEKNNIFFYASPPLYKHVLERIQISGFIEIFIFLQWHCTPLCYYIIVDLTIL